MARRDQTGRVWLPADTSLWTTCHIAFDLVNSRVPDYRVETMFPLGAGEIALVGGAFSVDGFYAAGDGTYQRSTGFAFGTGLFGLALAAGTLTASAVGNASRRNQAAREAQVTWRPLFTGSIVVTNSGFVLQTMDGLFRWDWSSIDLMSVVAYNQVILQGRSTDGQVTWRLNSEWAELVFVVWALTRHPNHPQLRDGSWLPAHWLEWATAQGYRPHLSRAQLAP